MLCGAFISLRRSKQSHARSEAVYSALRPEATPLSAIICIRPPPDVKKVFDRDSSISAEALVSAKKTLLRIVNGFTSDPAARSYARRTLIRSDAHDLQLAKTESFRHRHRHRNARLHGGIAF